MCISRLYICCSTINYPLNNNNYGIVLEDRTGVKNEQEVGTLSVVSGIDEAGKLKTSEAKETQQASFLKFNN